MSLEIISTMPVLSSPLNKPQCKMFKGLMDISGALAALIIFSPFFLVIYVLVKRDGGPAFYGHTRIGKGGKSFKCWKFRSMRPDADAVLQELLENDPAARAEWERDFKLRHDPRVTKSVRF